MNISLHHDIDLVLNQDHINSCTSNSICLIVFMLMRASNNVFWLPSSLYLYFNIRRELGTEGTDSGSTLVAAFSALDKHGLCPESMWPFSRSNILVEPPHECYEFSKQWPIQFKYYPIHSIDDLCDAFCRHCLVVCNIFRFPLQHVDQNGFIVMDNPEPEACTWWHTIVVIGVDIEHSCVNCVNSHGSHDTFFRISFTDFWNDASVMQNEIYAIGATFPCRLGLNPILKDAVDLGTTPAILEGRLHNIFSLTRPCIRVVEKEWDHIIIGGGLTAWYMVLRLLDTHGETCRILVVDDCGPCSMSSFEFRSSDDPIDHYLPSSAYRYHEMYHTLLYHLIGRIYSGHETGVRPIIDLRTDLDDAEGTRLGSLCGRLRRAQPLDDWDAFRVACQTEGGYHDMMRMLPISFFTFMTENAGLEEDDVRFISERVLFCDTATLDTLTWVNGLLYTIIEYESIECPFRPLPPRLVDTLIGFVDRVYGVSSDVPLSRLSGPSGDHPVQWLKNCRGVNNKDGTANIQIVSLCSSRPAVGTTVIVRSKDSVVSCSNNAYPSTLRQMVSIFYLFIGESARMSDSKHLWDPIFFGKIYITKGSPWIMCRSSSFDWTRYTWHTTLSPIIRNGVFYRMTDLHQHVSSFANVLQEHLDRIFPFPIMGMVPFIYDADPCQPTTQMNGMNWTDRVIDPSVATNAFLPNFNYAEGSLQCVENRVLMKRSSTFF